ncbi:hypothetical protein IM792_06160 [Mucilaginibacter sp. JRF]|uniref:hypothetical protein n=1 Tax=Mucilaginibacter sp. JRF TaxID=2780088 RepID=UPI00187F7CAD|nr:hypothetical protein [Mucilaginibacter sp. JRF]MBE9584027.1 hypothetical protein [Mucilaginibacter sp. JRF]
MRSLTYIYIIVAILVLFGRSAKAQDDWLMKTAITDSVPVPQEWKVLCKTDSGRRMIMESLPIVTKHDIKFQWLGIKMQDSLRSVSVGEVFDNAKYKPTLEEFYMKTIEGGCTIRPGGETIKIIDPNKMIFYHSGTLWCSSRNSGGDTKYDCNEKIPLMLPEGWQVCKLFFEQKIVRHGRFRFEPIFKQYDSQVPARIIGHNLYLTGHGDVGNPSSVYISNIKVYAIKSNLDNKFREECGCDMPLPITQSVSNPKPVETAVTQTAKISSAIINIKGNRADFVYRNEGGKSGVLCYKIIWYDTDIRDWKRDREGCVEILPNTAFIIGLHHWTASDYKFEYNIVQ